MAAGLPGAAGGGATRPRRASRPAPAPPARRAASGRGYQGGPHQRVREPPTGVARAAAPGGGPARSRRCPQGFHRAPQARAACWRRAPRWARGQPAARLGHGRGAGLRHPAAGGHAGAAGRARTRGAAPSATGTPCSTTTRPATPYTPLAHLREGQGPVEIRDSLALRGGRAGVRVRLQPRHAGGADHLGGAVRRLRQLRPGDRSTSSSPRPRPSGTGSPAWCCCCRTAWRGRGRSTPRRGSSASWSCRVDDNLQVVNLTTPAQIFHALRRQVRSPLPQAAGGDVPQEPAPAPGGRLAAARPGRGRLPARAAGRGRPIRPRSTRVVLCSGKLYYDLAAARDAGGGGPRGHRPAGGALPAARRRAPRRARAATGPASSSSGRRRSRPTWAPGTTSTCTSRRGSPLPLRLVARPASASPAVGSSAVTSLEQEQLVRQALGEPASRLQRPETRAAVQEH